jgi:hypothetical protein
MIPRKSLQSLVHKALLHALEQNAAYHKPNMEWMRDSDGFLSYTGTLDVTTMADRMTLEIEAGLKERETYEILKVKYGD